MGRRYCRRINRKPDMSTHSGLFVCGMHEDDSIVKQAVRSVVYCMYS